MYVSFLRTVDQNKLHEIFGHVLKRPCSITTSDGKFLWANRAWCNMLGYSYQELLGVVRWDQITSNKEDLETDLLMLQQLIDGKEISYEIIKYYITKGQERVHVRVTITRIPYSGQIDWFFVEAEVLGDEEKEALDYASAQISKLADTFTTSHTEIVDRIDKLIIQQERVINLWEKSQWFSQICYSGVTAMMSYAEKNPVYATITVIVIATLMFGSPVVETIREVASLFGITLGVPIQQAPPNVP